MPQHRRRQKPQGDRLGLTAILTYRDARHSSPGLRVPAAPETDRAVDSGSRR